MFSSFEALVLSFLLSVSLLSFTSLLLLFSWVVLLFEFSLLLVVLFELFWLLVVLFDGLVVLGLLLLVLEIPLFVLLAGFVVSSIICVWVFILKVAEVVAGSLVTEFKYPVPEFIVIFP